MRYHVLGPLDVRTDTGLVELSPKLRDLLATLLCHTDRPVSADRLVDVLWGRTAPRSALKTLRGYVHHLRRALGPERLVSRAAGYVLVVRPGELDAETFADLAARGGSAVAQGRPEVGAAAFDQALSLWRGTAYEDQDHLVPVHQEAVRLGELRLGVAEERVETELALGRHTALVGELLALVKADPFRERPRAQLALALYRAGRTSEALETCRQGRRLLADELGLDPGPALVRLETAILRHDPSLAAPAVEAGRQR